LIGQGQNKKKTQPFRKRTNYARSYKIYVEGEACIRGLTASLGWGTTARGIYFAVLQTTKKQVSDGSVYNVLRYKLVDKKVWPQGGIASGEQLVHQQILEDLLQTLPPLPYHAPDFMYTTKLTEECMKQVKIDDNSYLWPEEKQLFKHVMQLNEKALAWNADERGFFCSDYFSPYKIATVLHVLWFKKNISIPMGHWEQFVQIIQEKINAGVYKQSQSSYWSAYFCVIKKDSSLCLVHDPQPLNGVSIWDTGQASLIDDFVNNFACQQMYTMLDMFSGYNAWLIHPESRLLMVFQAPSHHLLQTKSLPMGYTNSVPKFQNCMNLILQDKIPSKAGVFIDDVGIKGHLAPQGMDGWKTEVIPQNKGIHKFI
jgi:hypothetical protein